MIYSNESCVSTLIRSTGYYYGLAYARGNRCHYHRALTHSQHGQMVSIAADTEVTNPRQHYKIPNYHQ